MTYLDKLLEEIDGADARYIRGCHLGDPDRLAFYFALERNWPVIKAALTGGCRLNLKMETSARPVK